MPDSATWRENDTLHVGSVWASTYGLKLQCGISAFIGRIAYVASPTVDQPLELIRLNLEAQVPNIGGLTTSCQGESYYDYFKWPGPLVYAPVYDWRGVADEGTLANGAARSYTATGEGAFAQPPWQDIVDNFNRFGVGVDQWFGEVVTQKKDGSGQMYRRNRFYDPQTGLFTQEDPAGLAGGLNAYGFADGDPINYDDPFGLCPPQYISGSCAQNEVGQLVGGPGTASGSMEIAKQLARMLAPLQKISDNTYIGVSATSGNYQMSVAAGGAGKAVTANHSLVFGVPNLAASIDVGLVAAAPSGSHTGSFDIGFGKHLSLSFNGHSDESGSVGFDGVTFHLGTPNFLDFPASATVDLKPAP
jgi:RHS repeat-associated protein